MTPNGEPTTEAGRALLNEPWWSRRFSRDQNFIRAAILAIEDEARATATPGLREAIEQAMNDMGLEGNRPNSIYAAEIADRVAALSASGETEP